MIRDPREKLLTLINRAVSPTDAEDQEARTAAVQACKLISKHPELVARLHPASASSFNPRVVSWSVAHNDATLAQEESQVPARQTKTSTIHPDAERLLEWRAMLQKKQAREAHATAATICADCGRSIARGEPVVERLPDALATHLGCARWWWNFRPQPTVDYDIAS